MALESATGSDQPSLDQLPSSDQEQVDSQPLHQEEDQDKVVQAWAEEGRADLAWAEEDTAGLVEDMVVRAWAEEDRAEEDKAGLEEDMAGRAWAEEDKADLAWAEEALPLEGLRPLPLEGPWASEEQAEDREDAQRHEDDRQELQALVDRLSWQPSFGLFEPSCSS